MRYQVAILTTLCATVLSQYIPTYIKRCDLKKPDFKRCALENGNYAIPHLVKGDKRLGIPSMTPLRLPLIDVEQNNVKFTLRDVEVHGLENAQLKNINLENRHFDVSLHIENLKILGTYSIDGNILLLSLKGEGRANMTCVGGDYEITATLEPYQKKGETYLKFTNPDIDFKLKRAYFQFDNLLNGNQQLGTEINDLLNESWEDVIKDLGVPIKQTVSSLIQSIVSKILEKVPEKDIYGS